jgi:hypothetical protein
MSESRDRRTQQTLSKQQETVAAAIAAAVAEAVAEAARSSVELWCRFGEEE